MVSSDYMATRTIPLSSQRSKKHWCSEVFSTRTLQVLLNTDKSDVGAITSMITSDEVDWLLKDDTSLFTQGPRVTDVSCHRDHYFVVVVHDRDVCVRWRDVETHTYLKTHFIVTKEPLWDDDSFPAVWSNSRFFTLNGYRTLYTTSVI